MFTDSHCVLMNARILAYLPVSLHASVTSTDVTKLLRCFGPKQVRLPTPHALRIRSGDQATGAHWRPCYMCNHKVRVVKTQLD